MATFGFDESKNKVETVESLKYAYENSHNAKVYFVDWGTTLEVPYTGEVHGVVLYGTSAGASLFHLRRVYTGDAYITRMYGDVTASVTVDSARKVLTVKTSRTGAISFMGITEAPKR